MPIFTGERWQMPPVPDESTWEDVEITGLKSGEVLANDDWDPNRGA